MEFAAYVASIGLNAETLTAEQKITLQRAWRSDAARGEAGRDDLLERYLAKCGNEADAAAVRATFDSAAEQGLDLRTTELGLMRAARGTAPIPFSRGGGDVARNTAIEAGLMVALGVNESAVEKLHDARTMQYARDQKYHRLGLHSLFRMQLQESGRHAPHGRLGESDIRDAMRISQGMMASVGVSTGVQVPGILSNVANKSAMASFMATPTTWQLFSKTMPLNDFKPATLYRMTHDLEFEVVAPAGEIKHGSASEDSVTLTAETKGKLIGLSRNDLVNDDLQVFSTVPPALGRAGAISIDKAVYTAILANTGSFFSSGNSNTIADTALAVLNLAGLEAAEGAFLALLDDAGNPAFIEPKYLLTSPTQAATARSLVADSPLIGGSSAAPSANAFAGRFIPIASPWLHTAAGLTGSLNTQWYLLAEAGDFAITVVGFLNNQKTPIIETAEFSFDRLGMSWRGYFDYGVSLLEPKGGYRSNGEAS